MLFLLLLLKIRITSSGLIEAPSFAKPTINIGVRQGGRVKSPSVIDCAADATEIREAIDVALSEEFLAICLHRINLYGGPGAAEKTLNIIKKWNGQTRRKEFVDL